jgi:hypothetical protein
MEIIAMLTTPEKVTFVVNFSGNSFFLLIRNLHFLQKMMSNLESYYGWTPQHLLKRVALVTLFNPCI